MSINLGDGFSSCSYEICQRRHSQRIADTVIAVKYRQCLAKVLFNTDIGTFPQLDTYQLLFSSKSLTGFGLHNRSGTTEHCSLTETHPVAL